ncbi:MAG TPA: AMP-dependent synthetase/ligase [Acetobacteraceae bacterium]|jgi:long-chain acyl-CoA synthetase|nr:AMP-dependent synthetase/ligase [Acetobacteraceae bacterium]
MALERYGSWPNVAAMMFARSREWPDQPMLRWHRDGAWHGMRWGAFGRAAASTARRLRALGVAPGDRVLIVSENRPEFPIAETALLAIRAVPVPTYTTNTVGDHAHVLRDSGARVAIVSQGAFAERVAEAGPLDRIITMEPFASPRISVTPWGELIGDDAPIDDVVAEAAGIAPGTMACIIYTSGTAGAPRGVMLPHRALLANCYGAFELVRPLALNRETYLSFLPLSHSYEHLAGQFFLLSIGTEVVYSRGVEHLASDMTVVRPTVMTVVPRILDVIRSRILAQVAREPAWRQALFQRAIAVGAARGEGLPVALADRVLDPLLERLVRRRVRARFGGRLRVMMSGGARLEPEVGKFYLGLGIAMLQGYGQTEAGPVISANTAGAARIATVGRPLPGVEVRIAEDGEILVRGDLVMDGYWGKPEETARAMVDGWLRTGDVGQLDERGFLTITDRKKDLIVLSGGENVSPARIEGMLVAEPAIAQACVFGEGRAGIAALAVAAEGFDEVAVAAAVSMVNKRLSVTERVRRHAVVAPFTLQNGMLTPSHKVKRHEVVREYGKVLERLMA